MPSILSLNQALQTLFFEIAPSLAAEEGVIKRQRCFSASSLFMVLVLGWLQYPQAGPSQLARFAHTVGVKISKQALAQRLTFVTAAWLKRVLEQAVMLLVRSTPLAHGLLERFSAVIIEDASRIQLPASLVSHWKGPRGTPSALKFAVRWDLRSGQLEGPCLQDGSEHETHNAVHQMVLPENSVYIADTGYCTFSFLKQLDKERRFFIVRLRGNGVVSTLDGHRLDLAALLRAQGDRITDLTVRFGSLPSLWFTARLIARPVSDSAARHQREKRAREARKHGYDPSPTAQATAGWILLVTNVPAELGKAEEIVMLYRTRWQIELLFKLWKSQGCVDEWKSCHPEQILCELYAKLLAMLVQHWTVVASCWEDPYRSFTSLAELVRSHVPFLLQGLLGHFPLQAVLLFLGEALFSSASIPARKKRPSTAHQLVDGLFRGLT